MKAIFSSARTKSGKTSCTLYHKVRVVFWLVLCVVMSLLFSCRGGKAGGGSKLTPEDSAEIAMLLDSAKSVSGQDYLRLLAISKETEKLAIAKKDTASWAEALSNEVLAYFHMGIPDSALIVSRTQIHLDSLLGEISYLSSDYSNIASICLSTHQLEQAKNYIDRAIELEKQVKDHPNLSIRYGVASEIYNSLELRDKALSFAKQAYDLDMARKDTLKAGRRLSQMGDIYFAMPDFEAAHRCYRQAVEWLEAKGERHSLGLTYQHLGDMLIQQKKPAEAIPYFERAIAISREIHSRRQEMQACKGLAQAYHSTGKDALAYEQYEAFSILKDSVFSSETSRQLSELQVRYESAEKDLQLLSQQKRLGSMRNLTIGLLLGIFVLLSIVGVLYAFNRIRAKNNLLLKKLEEIRSNFFTNITHEFRTPLTIIIGLVERMQKSREALPKQCAADMMTIQQQSNELLNLVNQLLDYSKVKSAVGMGTWVTGDIRPVVSMAVEVQQSYATAKGITLTFAMADKPVMTDYVADYLNKVLRNLLSNAIKFTSSGGRILVTLKDDDQHVVLRIADTGCGIPRDDLRFIFNPFY